MAALDRMDSGNEVYESYMVAKTITAPAVSAGRRLYRSQVAKAQEKKIKKVQAGKKIGKKTVRDSAAKTAKYSAKKVAKEAAKETAKTAAKATAKTTAATAAGTAISPGVGTAIGVAAGYAAGIAVDYKDMQVTNRGRKLKFFLDKLNAEEQQKDSFAKLVRDLALSRVSFIVKAAAPIAGLVLLLLALLVAVVAIPVIAVIAVIYNSPYAVLFVHFIGGDNAGSLVSVCGRVQR